jgi:hypothetical protein
MAKITRKVAKVFGSNAGVNEIAKFGSLAAGTPLFSTDPAVIQALGNWLGGWFSGVEAGNSPAIEDMNAFCYVMAYQIAYQMQTGVPEWDATTTYYVGSVVNDGAGNLYSSLTNSNLNNVLTSATNWLPIVQGTGIVGSNPNCINIGFKYSAGTFTICAGDQSSLSSTNPAYVLVPSVSNPGMMIKIPVTANVTLTDVVGSGDLNGMLFGTTTARAWANDRPFYIYAANKDDTAANLAFFITPRPNQTAVYSASTGLGYKGNAPSSTADTNNVFLLSSSPSSYVSKPCTLIGGICMTKNTSNNWTINLNNITPNQPLVSNHPYENIYFQMPVGQNGADASAYFSASGASGPTFSNNIYNYKVSTSGRIFIGAFFTTSAVNGASANAIELSMPLSAKSPFGTAVAATSVGVFKASSHSPTTGTIIGQQDNTLGTRLSLVDTALTPIKGNEFSSSADTLFFSGYVELGGDGVFD